MRGELLLLFLGLLGFFFLIKITYLWLRRIPLPAKQESEAKKIFMNRACEGTEKTRTFLKDYFRKVLKSQFSLVFYFVLLCGILAAIFKILADNGRPIFTPLMLLMLIPITTVLAFMVFQTCCLRSDYLDKFDD